MADSNLRERAARRRDAVELALAQHEQRHVGVRGHAGRAGPTVEEGELAEVLAGPSVATLRLFRFTDAWPETIRKNSRPMVPCSHSSLPGHRDLLEARRMVRRSWPNRSRTTRIFERSRHRHLSHGEQATWEHVHVLETCS